MQQATDNVKNSYKTRVDFSHLVSLQIGGCKYCSGAPRCQAVTSVMLWALPSRGQDTFCSPRCHVHVPGESKRKVSAVLFSIIRETEKLCRDSPAVLHWCLLGQLCHTTIPGCKRDWRRTFSFPSCNRRPGQGPSHSLICRRRQRGNEGIRSIKQDGADVKAEWEKMTAQEWG